MTLKLVGTSIQLLHNTTILDSRPFNTVTAYTITDSSATSDQLTVDFSSGNPIPSGGLTFNGSTTGNTDALTVTGGAGFSTMVYNADQNGAGSLVFNGSSTLNVTNLTPMTVNPVAGTVTININQNGAVAGAITSTFTADASAGFDDVTFSAGASKA